MRCLPPSWLAPALALAAAAADAFYIPGWSIRTYKVDDHIPLMVNKVYSDNTQLQYAYYDLPFVCPPNRDSHGSILSGQSVALNLGEVLRGDRIVTSDMELKLGHDSVCSFLCSRSVSRRDLRRARDLVRDGYVVEWILDNLPGATSFVTVDKSRKYYAAGFKLGYTDYSASTGRPRYFLNNHHTLVARIRDAPHLAPGSGQSVVTGFEVYSKSISSATARDSEGCPADLQHVDDGFELTMSVNRTESAPSRSPGSLELDPLLQGDDDDMIDIPYTYSVYFRDDQTIEWDHRWDMYFVNQEEGSKIHWLAIINSLIICGILTGIVMMIIARTIRTDIKGYKDHAEDGKLRSSKRKPRSAPRSPRSEKTSLGLLEQETQGDEPDLSSDEEALEDVTGWKLLHADVFRKPMYGHLCLAPLVGSGMQLLFMAVGLVLLSATGILNPSLRGGFISAGVGLFVFAGAFSGYFSARIYKTFEGRNFVKNAIVTACLFPGLLFGLICTINLFVWAQASSTAIPFGTLIAIVLLWLCIQVPLVYIGSWYGYVKVGPWEHPTKTSSIPRQIPQQSWYTKSLQAILLAGLIPFAVIFIELLFVFQSMWQDKSGYYYMFGFLAVVSVILVVTIAEVTIVTVYIQLCSENYHWWWQSFFVGGGSAFWVFVYCVWYYMFKLHITGFVSSMLFFVYSFIACCVYGLLTGTVGFLTAYAFVRRIYGAIKAD